MSEKRELTVGLMNAALWPVSRKHGYCLCINAMRALVDCTGLNCGDCGQPITVDSTGPGAKAIRTEAIKAAYPWTVKGASA